MALELKWDVAVVGDGIAGHATALALSRRGVARVGIVGPQTAPTVRIGESIPPDTRLALKTLGIWDDFQRQCHALCLGSCSAWGSSDLGYNDFMLNPYGAGWHLNRRCFDVLLSTKAKEAGVQFVQARVRQISRTCGPGFLLDLVAGESLRTQVRAKTVIDATGTRAAIAERLGARRRFLDRLLFVCGFFDTTEASRLGKLTLLEAEHSGWWYAASLPQKRLIVALATDSEVIRDQRLREPDQWLARLLGISHIAGRLDGVRLLAGGMVIRSAPSFLLEPAGGTDWLAVGDAASAYDPLAAQGIYKALNDGLLAAEAVISGDHVGYLASVRSQFETYLINRNYIYSLERRWPDSEFWSRRQRRTGLEML